MNNEQIEKMVAEAANFGIERDQLFAIRTQLLNLYHGLKFARHTLKYSMKCENIRVNNKGCSASCEKNGYKIVWTSIQAPCVKAA